MYNAQKMKFSIKDFFSKCDQICYFLCSGKIFLKHSLSKCEQISSHPVTKEHLKGTFKLVFFAYVTKFDNVNRLIGISTFSAL